MIITPFLVVVSGLTVIVTLFGCRFRPYNDYNPFWLSFLGLTVTVTPVGHRIRPYNDCNHIVSFDVFPHAVNASSNLPCSVLPNFKIKNKNSSWFSELICRHG